jgi:hypothetical protein
LEPAAAFSAAGETKKTIPGNKETKVKITLKSLTVFLAVLIFSYTALAQAKNKVIVSKDGRVVFAQAPSHVRIPYVDENAGLKVIYSNLASKHPKGLYFALEGQTLNGPNTGSVQWDAVPFTPAADATVTKIQLPIGYIYASTSTDVIVSLNADSNGLPGNALQTWVVPINKADNFGSCCAVYTEKGSVPVTAGQQYWVVASTESNSDMSAAWNLNTTDEVDQVTNAYYDGTGWYTYPTTNGIAVGVYGH